MLLEVENIDFKYGEYKVLDKINFSLKQGEILALLGANGAGKSTLLKCINRILVPDNGSIKINGRHTSTMNRNTIAKNISYVPQHHTPESITVFESVLLGRKPYIKWDLSNSDMEIARAFIEQLGLINIAKRKTYELSGGEMQKVAIARALTQQPQLLLLDEPTSNLDPKNQIDILKIVNRIAFESNIGVIISVHDLNMALRYADKFLLLKDNKVYACVDKDLITSEMIKNIYGIDVFIEEVSGYKVVILK